MPRKIALSLALFAATVLLSSHAFAKEKSAESIKKSDGYAYVFKDDPLAGNSGGATAARIRVLPRGVRHTLIRPRLQFIPELLISVEQL
jgi:hypothetical protein